MPRKVDANQPEIVKALRQCGAHVQDLHTIGRGCPDILILWSGGLMLAEIKSEHGKLTPVEQAWHAAWPGPVYVLLGFQTLNGFLPNKLCVDII